MAVEDQVAVIYAATNGYLDRVDADRVQEFHEKLVERLHSAAKDTLDSIAEGDWSDDIQRKLDEAIDEFASDFGYDLDEEGQPLSDEDAIKEGSGRPSDRKKSSDDDSDDESDASGDEESERETVGAGS
jgi:F-type H+-transporting ATPase subunit alpha